MSFLNLVSYLKSRAFVTVRVNKILFLMHISNKCNEESRGEYEMFNKQRVITEIDCEKAQKVLNSFRVAK